MCAPPSCNGLDVAVRVAAARRGRHTAAPARARPRDSRAPPVVPPLLPSLARSPARHGRLPARRRHAAGRGGGARRRDPARRAAGVRVVPQEAVVARGAAAAAARGQGERAGKGWRAHVVHVDLRALPDLLVLPGGALHGVRLRLAQRHRRHRRRAVSALARQAVSTRATKRIIAPPTDPARSSLKSAPTGAEWYSRNMRRASGARTLARGVRPWSLCREVVAGHLFFVRLHVQYSKHVPPRPPRARACALRAVALLQTGLARARWWECGVSLNAPSCAVSLSRLFDPVMQLLQQADGQELITSSAAPSAIQLVAVVEAVVVVPRVVPVRGLLRRRSRGCHRRRLERRVRGLGSGGHGRRLERRVRRRLAG